MSTNLDNFKPPAVTGERDDYQHTWLYNRSFGVAEHVVYVHWHEYNATQLMLRFGPHATDQSQAHRHESNLTVNCGGSILRMGSVGSFVNSFLDKLGEDSILRCKCGVHFWNNQLLSTYDQLKRMPGGWPYGHLCDACRQEVVNAEYKAEEEQEAKKLEKVRAQQKRSGMRWHAVVWVHSGGDDEQVDLFLPHATEAEARAEVVKYLKRRRSVVLTDYGIEAL